ncbi:hypothetical protein V2G26_018793 [Clonostachys chloroleuca]
MALPLPVIRGGAGTASPPGPGHGYESPTEENYREYFATAPGTMTPVSQIHVHSRPALLTRPSYVAALPPDPHVLSASLAALDDVVATAEKIPPNSKVSIKDRIKCYQWTYFTMTMATGGVANVIYGLGYTSAWVNGFGLFFYLLNIVLFLNNCVCISVRFHLMRGSFIKSFTDQFECLFIPAFFVSIAIILTNTCQYGVEHSGFWLFKTLQVLFWFYVASSVLASAGMYLILWSTQVFPVHTMTPTWVFPAYPLLVIAPFAANLIAAAERSGNLWVLNKPAVAMCAVTLQGTGCLIAFMISAAFIYRLMTQKLPRDIQRPGVFISIGPYGFTAAGIVQLGQQANLIAPPGFLGSELTVDILKVLSVLVGLWFWGLCIWFFLVSLGSLWKYVRTGSSIPFQMTWWSFVFPNTALVTATQTMSKVFDSQGIHICACVLTVVLVIVWVGVFITMLHYLRTKKLLYPKQRK